MSEQEKVMEARKKLAQKYGQTSTRLGGKGTMKRKIKVTHKSATGDDKKAKELSKKLQCQPLPEISEVNFFTNDNKVTQFKNVDFSGNIQNQVFIVSGSSETKDVKDCFAELVGQMTSEQIENIKKIATTQVDDVAPKLVNFEDAAKSN